MKKNIRKGNKLISSGKEFKKILKEKEAFFVLFSSESCGYCKLAEKNIKEVIDSFPQLDLYQIKLSTAPEIFEEYGVNSVPVAKIFKNGEAVYTAFGVRSPDDIYYQLKDYFDSGSSYFKELENNS